MNFSKTRPVKIVMIGAGGTGGHIAPHLYRLLYALDRPVKFIICDGDIVEEKNLVRQNFTQADLGENKAKVVAERYSNVFGLETSYVPDFIEDLQRLEQLICPMTWTSDRFVKDPKTRTFHREVFSELVILIGAVDNHRSRQMCHEVFLKSRELIYIDSGNGEYTGQVVCGIRHGGKTISLLIRKSWPGAVSTLSPATSWRS
jgi:molybdopterin/thiamine biosynthesis adenylyltransferase